MTQNSNKSPLQQLKQITAAPARRKNNDEEIFWYKQQAGEFLKILPLSLWKTPQIWDSLISRLKILDSHWLNFLQEHLLAQSQEYREVLQAISNSPLPDERSLDSTKRLCLRELGFLLRQAQLGIARELKDLYLPVYRDLKLVHPGSFLSFEQAFSLQPQATPNDQHFSLYFNELQETLLSYLAELEQNSASSLTLTEVLQAVRSPHYDLFQGLFLIEAGVQGQQGQCESLPAGKKTILELLRARIVEKYALRSEQYIAKADAADALSSAPFQGLLDSLCLLEVKEQSELFFLLLETQLARTLAARGLQLSVPQPRANIPAPYRRSRVIEFPQLQLEGILARDLSQPTTIQETVANIRLMLLENSERLEETRADLQRLASLVLASESTRQDLASPGQSLADLEKRCKNLEQEREALLSEHARLQSFEFEFDETQILLNDIVAGYQSDLLNFYQTKFHREAAQQTARAVFGLTHQALSDYLANTGEEFSELRALLHGALYERSLAKFCTWCEGGCLYATSSLAESDHYPRLRTESYVFEYLWELLRGELRLLALDQQVNVRELELSLIENLRSGELASSLTALLYALRCPGLVVDLASLPSLVAEPERWREYLLWLVRGFAAYSAKFSANTYGALFEALTDVARCPYSDLPWGAIFHLNQTLDSYLQLTKQQSLHFSGDTRRFLGRAWARQMESLFRGDEQSPGWLYLSLFEIMKTAAPRVWAKVFLAMLEQQMRLIKYYYSSTFLPGVNASRRNSKSAGFSKKRDNMTQRAIYQHALLDLKALRDEANKILREKLF